MPTKSHGGPRSGSGRKSAFGEPTQLIRVPTSKAASVVTWLESFKLSNRKLLPDESIGQDPRKFAQDTTLLAIPVLGRNVPAGFPSPADDYLDGTIDLNQHLITNAEATFILRVSGVSMIGAGIYDGDEVIVDRSITARSGRIVVAAYNGELTIKRLLIAGADVRLHAENPDFPNIVMAEGQELMIWGVVTRVLHRV